MSHTKNTYEKNISDTISAKFQHENFKCTLVCIRNMKFLMLNFIQLQTTSCINISDSAFPFRKAHINIAPVARKYD